MNNNAHSRSGVYDVRVLYWCDDRRLKFVQRFQYTRKRSPVPNLSVNRAGSLYLGEPVQHGGREVAGCHGKSPVHVEHPHGAGFVSRLDELNDP